MRPSVYGYGFKLALSPKINPNLEEFCEIDGWVLPKIIERRKAQHVGPSSASCALRRSIIFRSTVTKRVQCLLTGM